MRVTGQHHLQCQCKHEHFNGLSAKNLEDSSMPSMVNLNLWPWKDWDVQIQERGVLKQPRAGSQRFSWVGNFERPSAVWRSCASLWIHSDLWFSQMRHTTVVGRTEKQTSAGCPQTWKHSSHSTSPQNTLRAMLMLMEALFEATDWSASYSSHHQ